MAANEKLEIAARDQPDGQATGPLVSEQECQCDLSTEHYEKVLDDERQQSQSLTNQLLLKQEEISALQTSLKDAKESLSLEISDLREKMSILQVEFFVVLRLCVNAHAFMLGYSG